MYGGRRPRLPSVDSRGQLSIDQKDFSYALAKVQPGLAQAKTCSSIRRYTAHKIVCLPHMLQSCISRVVKPR
jgi:hypothetical protein